MFTKRDWEGVEREGRLLRDEKGGIGREKVEGRVGWKDGKRELEEVT